MNKKFGVDKFLSSLFKSKDEISLLNYEIEKAGYKDFILLDTGKDTERYIFTDIERIEDAGTTASLNMDVPARYLPCLTAGLAYYISIKKPEAQSLAPMLKQVYDEQWEMASDAAREKASFQVSPGGYSNL